MLNFNIMYTQTKHNKNKIVFIILFNTNNYSNSTDYSALFIPMNAVHLSSTRVFKPPLTDVAPDTTRPIPGHGQSGSFGIETPIDGNWFYSSSRVFYYRLGTQQQIANSAACLFGSSTRLGRTRGHHPLSLSSPH